MRTTVEITTEQHRALTELARRRGVRGFSPLVQEAIDAYLSGLDDDELEAVLALEGVLGDDEAERMQAAIAEQRGQWRTVS